ncbi:MAG: hypothetical protein AAGJ50_01785, partial [Pseudomonadota bacterium]
MTLVLRVLKWLGIVLLIGLIFGLAWPWRVVLSEGFTGAKYQDYLGSHMQVPDLAGDTPTFSFPPEFYDNRLYLVGEIHGTQRAQDIDLA